MKIGIVLVPYISCDKHLELAKASVKTFTSKHHELQFYTICNNYRTEEDTIWLQNISEFYKKNYKNNLSLAWNNGIEQAFKNDCEYVLVPNLDVEFFDDTIDNLITFAQQTEDQVVLWSGINVITTGKQEIKDDTPTQTPDFSNFMVNYKTIKTIGWFDTTFEPCYYEDNDYHRRINLSKHEAYQTKTSQYIHYGSQTIRNDRALEMRNVSTFRRNQLKYINKWGGLPGQEKFYKPYNGTGYKPT